RELVAEEERMKRKAEKKKLKKKKQKDRKKQEKLEQEQKNKREAESVAGGESSWHGCQPGTGSALQRAQGSAHLTLLPPQDELDLSCTFVSKARQKAGVKLPVPSKEKPPGTGTTKPGKRAPGKVRWSLRGHREGPMHPMAGVSSSGSGNEAAQRGCYGEAVEAFTQALSLNPREHRLFGNRSYCLEKLGLYEEALEDAQESLRLRPGWPKGSFRKGKALRGLQRYAEAISTFEELLRRDGADAEAAAQLRACQALLLVSPSPLPRVTPPTLVPSHGPEPLSPQQSSRRSSSGGVPVGSCRDTDTSSFVTVVSSRSQARGQGRPAASSPQTLPPTHPARDCYPLWVGNVTPWITEKVLQGAFGRFGEIRFIRLLPGRHCAFVNFARKKAAEAAYKAMQDVELEGSRLVLQLKHPSHATPSPLRHP
ncbi:TTC31 protein, partial [Brachypteracias leptosomus]|nr:TTC31 protein [Brachypteracias leptosomus]